MGAVRKLVRWYRRCRVTQQMARILVFDFARPGAAVVQLLPSVKLSTATFEIYLLHLLFNSVSGISCGWFYVFAMRRPPPPYMHTHKLMGIE